MGTWNAQMLSPSAEDNVQLTEVGSPGRYSSVSRVGDVGIVDPQRANFSAIEWELQSQLHGSVVLLFAVRFFDLLF